MRPGFYAWIEYGYYIMDYQQLRPSQIRHVGNIFYESMNDTDLLHGAYIVKFPYGSIKAFKTYSGWFIDNGSNELVQFDPAQFPFLLNENL